MKFKYLIISIIFLLIIPAIYATNYGLAPASMSIDAAKGQEYQKLMRVTSGSNEEHTYTLTSEDVPDSWIKFYNVDKTTQLTEVTIPSNKYVEFMTVITIPADTANGVYNAKIKTKTVTEEMQESGSAVAVEYTSVVTITISGQEDLEGEVRSITISNAESGQPLRIKVDFQNNGNVKARPTIKAEIKKDNQLVDNIEFSDVIVDSKLSKIIDVEWDTAGRGVGDFKATVEVYLGTELLDKKFIDFKILERGTLSSEGEVFKVTDPEKISQNELTKLEVEFYNRGSIDFKAELTGEIYLNNKLIDTLDSAGEVLVKVNGKQTLAAYFTPKSQGDYVIKRWVSYEGNKLDIKDLKFTIGKGGETSLTSGSKKASSSNMMIVLGISVVVLLLILLIILLLVIVLKKSK